MHDKGKTTSWEASAVVWSRDNSLDLRGGGGTGEK